MGVLGTVLGLMVILVVVAFGWGYIQDIVFDVIREGENTFARIETSGIIEVTPTAEETLCDLTITLDSTLNAEDALFAPFLGAGLGSGLRVDFDPSIKTYQWSKCESTKTTVASLLNLAGLRNFVFPTPVPASLFCSVTNCPFSASAELVTEIELEDAETGDVLNRFNSGGNFVHVADVAGKQSPVELNQIFRLSDIPHRNFHLDISVFGQDDSGTFSVKITVGGGDSRFIIAKETPNELLRDEVCKSTETSFPCL